MSGEKLSPEQLDRYLGITAGDTSAVVEAASVLAAFDPFTIRPADPPQSVDRGQILDELLPKSEPAPGASGEEWALLFHERRTALRKLGGKDAMRQARRANSPSSVAPLQRMTDLVLGEGPIALDSLSRDDLGALVTVLGWFEGILPNLPEVSDVRKALAREDLLAPFRRLAGHGFVGRKDELQQMHDFVFGRTWPAPLFIYGAGGVGKSALLSRFVLKRLLPAGCGIAYLDLDRPTLRPDQPHTLILELVRQLQAQFDLPDDAVDPFRKRVNSEFARQDDSRFLESFSPSLAGLGSIPTELGEYLKRWLGDRVGVLIVDTLEEAQFRGPEIVDSLVEALLAIHYSSGLRVILAGRALPEEFVAQAFQDTRGDGGLVPGPVNPSERAASVPLPYRPINLTELDLESAAALLRTAMQDLGVTPLRRREAEEVIGIVSRNPMCVRLAARLLRDEGVDQLYNSRSEFLAKLKAEKIQAYLYSRILLNVHLDDVRKVAYPGLIVRRITPQVIRDVLAEPCGLDLHPPRDEYRILDDLRREAALMEVDAVDATVLHHRLDVRKTMLADLTDHIDAEVIGAIHRKAIGYYEKDASGAARAEELYHRLCRGDTVDVLDPRWIPDAAPYLKNAIGEIPFQQRIWLAGKLGVTVDEAARAAADQEAWELQTRTAVTRLLQSGNASRALVRLRERSERLPRSPLYSLEAETLRILSDPDEALSVARKGVDSAGLSGATDMALELLLKMALIEEGRERIPEAIKLLGEAAGVAVGSSNRVLQFSVKVASVRLQRKLDPEDSHALRPRIDGALRFITLDLLRKLRTNPVTLREAAVELGQYDARIASLSIEVLGLDQLSDQQAKALSEIAQGQPFVDSQAPAGGLHDFDSSQFDPRSIKEWASKALSEHNVREIASKVQMDVGQDVLGDLSQHEAYGLEAIVMPKLRPTVLVRGTSYDDFADPWTHLNGGDLKAWLARVIASVGRIETPLNPVVPYAGAGFLAGPGLMLTCRHAAQLFSTGLGFHVRYQAGGAEIDFNKRVEDPDGDRTGVVKVVGVELIHPYWDIAVLRVETTGARQPLTLSVTPPESLVDRDIVLISYPSKDFRTDVSIQDKITGGIYNVKRLEPGRVRPRSRINSFEHVVNPLTHDAATLFGRSGGAVVDIATGKVVGIHFASEYLKANYAVPMYELARDVRLAPLLNFDGRVPPTDEWEDAWHATERA